MRARIALSLSLALVLLLGGLVMDVSFAQETTILSVNPTSVSGNPGDIFFIDIDVTDVEDLYTFAFELHFAPYGKTLAVRTVTGSEFLGVDVIFSVFLLEGIVQVGGSLVGQIPGISGSGTLATIEFKVVEAGESELTLVNTELHDSSPTSLIPHTLIHSYFYGPTADVASATVKGPRGKSPFAFPGESLAVTSEVVNNGEVPLNVKVRYDLVRRDGRVTEFWAGQSFVTTPRAPEYLYVDEYEEFWEWDWDHYGTEPWLDAQDDGSYLESSTYDAASGTYGFENLTLSPGDVIGRVVMEGYTQYPGGPDEEMDMDMLVLLWEPFHFAWAGSLWGTAEYGWHTPRWIEADLSEVMPELTGIDATNLNNLLAFATYWTADELSHGPMRLDALRLRVEFSSVYPVASPIFIVEPGETLELDLSSWMLGEEDAGFYRGTATCYYSYYYPDIGYGWLTSEVTRSLLCFVWRPGPE